MKTEQRVIDLPPQIDYNLQQVRIDAILATRQVYDNAPEWQRGKVWKPIKKRKLIQTIIKGGYIPAIVFFPDKVLGKSKLYILDGKQRFSTIMEFINDEFTTGKGRGFIGGNSLYSELSEAVKTRILSYALGACVLNETDEARLREIYRSLQNLTPLTGSEVLFSYKSSAAEMAQGLMKHEFFARTYEGGRGRMEPISMCYMAMSIELANGTGDLSTRRLDLIASGEKDEFISPDMYDTIDERLFYCADLFEGCNFANMYALAVMYQAIYFLQACGVNLDSQASGILTSWFNGIEVPMDEPGRAFRYSYLPQMSKYGFQCSFWQNQLRDLATLPGLQITEEARRNCDGLASWFHHAGYCPECHQRVPFDEVGYHAFRLSDHCQDATSAEFPPNVYKIG